MRKYIVAVVLAAMGTLGFASISQAHWVGRTIKTDGNTWAIHYPPITGASRGWEIFQSYGTPIGHWSDLINMTTGIPLCTSPFENKGIGVHSSWYCPTSLSGSNARIRVVTTALPVPVNVGFYVRELP